MIAVDTNILVYSHREDSKFHTDADKKLTDLAEGIDPWAIAWPCIHEFLAIVTHPRIYDPPTPLRDALEQVKCWLEAPSLNLIGECEGYFEVLKELISIGQVTGPQIHDARIAAICQQHGIKVLWSGDRDFSRIKGLRVINPLL